MAEVEFWLAETQERGHKFSGRFRLAFDGNMLRRKVEGCIGAGVSSCDTMCRILKYTQYDLIGLKKVTPELRTIIYYWF